MRWREAVQATADNYVAQGHEELRIQLAEGPKPLHLRVTTDTWRY